jgi:ABC-2 type transport system permease protein
MSFLPAALAVARKDLRISLRDRTGLALGFLLPLVLVAVFSFVNRVLAGGDGGGAFSRAALWVADEDGSKASRRFVDALREASTLHVRPEAGKPPVDGAALRKRIVDGDIHHGLVVERGFGATIARGELPTLRLLRDPDRAIEEQLIAIGLMQATFSALGPDFSAPLTARALELAGLPKEWRGRMLAVSTVFTTSVEALFREKEERERPAGSGAAEPAGTAGGGGEAGGGTAGASKGEVGGGMAGASKADDGPAPSFQEMLTQLVPLVREDHRPPSRPRQLTYMLAQTVSGIGVMMLMFGLVACGTLLLREREAGTLPRLLLSPCDRSAILWGKFLFTAAMGAMQLVVLFAFGELVFRVGALRNPVTFAAVSISVLVAATSFGMLIGAWARTTRQAEGLATLVILVMSAVGGAWFPLQMLDLSTPVKVVMGCTLTHWGVSAYQGLFWHGKDLADSSMQLSIGVLWGFAIAAAALSRRLFERRYVGD